MPSWHAGTMSAMLAPEGDLDCLLAAFQCLPLRIRIALSAHAGISSLQALQAISEDSFDRQVNLNIRSMS